MQPHPEDSGSSEGQAAKPPPRSPGRVIASPKAIATAVPPPDRAGRLVPVVVRCVTLAVHPSQPIHGGSHLNFGEIPPPRRQIPPISRALPAAFRPLPAALRALPAALRALSPFFHFIPFVGLAGLIRTIGFRFVRLGGDRGVEGLVRPCVDLLESA